MVPGPNADIAEAARAVAGGAPTPNEARDEQVGGRSRLRAHLLPDVEHVTTGDAACSGNSIRQAGRLVPGGNREADGVAPHTIWPEIGGLPGALYAEHGYARIAGRVVGGFFGSLPVPFVRHNVIVSDMHIPG